MTGKKRAPNKSQKATKTTAKTTVPVGALIPQPHGGALRNGGTNAGGPGRPADLVRQRLVGAFEERIDVLERIADGRPVEEVDVPLYLVLEHATCPKCKGALQAKDAASLMMVSIRGLRSAKPGDRTKAMDVLAKYGLGTKDETVLTEHPEWTRRMAALRSALVEIVGDETATQVILRADELARTR
jgi:hypothetical protein